MTVAILLFVHYSTRMSISNSPQSIQAGQTRSVAARLDRFWQQHGTLLLWGLIAVSIVPLGLKYWLEIQHILGMIPGEGAVDMQVFYRWTHQWFEGTNIYQLANPRGYPPASLVMLYPFLGWETLDRARWVWAITTGCAFAAIVVVAIRALDARTLPECIALTLLLLANNGTSVTLGNGQPTLHILAMLLLSILFLHQHPVHWWSDLVAAALFIVALLKPNLSIPFIWLLVIFPTSLRVRPLLLVGFGYLALSFYASQIVRTPLWVLAPQFLASVINDIALVLDPNIQYLMAKLGLGRFVLYVSALIGLGLGIWIFVQRKKNIWFLLAVTAIVTRLWGYHLLYDNALLIPVEIALLLLVKREKLESSIGLAALMFLGLNFLVILPPGNLVGQAKAVQVALVLMQASVWLSTLLFFLWIVAEEKSQPDGVRNGNATLQTAVSV